MYLGIMGVGEIGISVERDCLGFVYDCNVPESPFLQVRLSIFF